MDNQAAMIQNQAAAMRFPARRPSKQFLRPSNTRHYAYHLLREKTLPPLFLALYTWLQTARLGKGNASDHSARDKYENGRQHHHREADSSGLSSGAQL